MDHEAASPEQKRAAYRFTHQLMHLVSLLHALMVKHLRKDFDLSTIYKHEMAGTPPFMDSNVGVRGWSRWEVFVVRVLALNDLFEIHNPQQQAEIPVIGGLSEEERARLTNLVPIPAMKGRGAALNGARPYAVFALINQLYIRRIKEGGLQTNAPLVGRLGGIAEEGMAAFGHCSKLASTQFPFAWAQVVMAFLAIMGLLLPFVVANFVEQLWMGVVLSFVVVLTYWSLNEVASEMEDPFGFDPNDLPLARYAFDFNNGLLASVHQLRPPYFDPFDAEEVQQPQPQEVQQQAQGQEQQRQSQRKQPSSKPKSALAAAAGSASDFSCAIQPSGGPTWRGPRGSPDEEDRNAAGRSCGGGGVSGSGGGGGSTDSGRAVSPDGPSTPMHAAAAASSPRSSRPVTSQASQGLTPSRWVAGEASVTASPDGSPSESPLAPSTQRTPSAATSQLGRPGPAAAGPETATTTATTTMLPLESARSISAGTGSGSGGGGGSGTPVPEAVASGGGAAAAAAAVIFATPFSRQASSSRCDSPRVSRKASAVLPLNC